MFLCPCLSPFALLTLDPPLSVLWRCCRSTSWNVAQAVSIAVVNDDIVEGNSAIGITVAVNSSPSSGVRDASYDDAVPRTVTVYIEDDDGGGFVLNQHAVAATESGAIGGFTVALIAQPQFDVVLSVVSTHAVDVSVDKDSLTFGHANWNVAQLVTVTAEEDAFVDGTTEVDVVIAVEAGASDVRFAGVPDQTVVVTTTDTSNPSEQSYGFRLSTTAVSAYEGGSTGSFTVQLTRQPNYDVVVDVTNPNTAEAHINHDSLTFRQDNWRDPQTLTVTAVDDQRLDGPTEVVLTLAVNTEHSDEQFQSAAARVVTVTTYDNDTPGFTLSTHQVAVAENGPAAVFTVVLDARPGSPVFISITSAHANDVSVAQSSLLFSRETWLVPQSVTVTAEEDAFVDGPLCAASQPRTLRWLAESVPITAITSSHCLCFAVAPDCARLPTRPSRIMGAQLRTTALLVYHPQARPPSTLPSRSTCRTATLAS